jgi:predicted NUDIX family NTP pyrophosphohydrolase
LDVKAGRGLTPALSGGPHLITPSVRFSSGVAALFPHDKIRIVPQLSAGLLMYRYAEGLLEVFLVHPGGPFWVAKDQGAWSIPKGLVGPGEDYLEAAKREFEEETSIRSSEPFLDLGEIRNQTGKRIFAWAFQGSAELPSVKSNLFTLEWPPHSGLKKEFPEIDKGQYFSLQTARSKINPAQAEFLDRLESLDHQQIIGDLNTSR